MLDLITAKALQKDQDTRYQRAAEMASDLRACLAQPRTEGTAAMSATLTATLLAERTVPAPAPGAGQVGTSANGTRVSTRQSERTRKNDATAGTNRIGASVLYLSRKRNSSEAMKRLEAMTMNESDGGSPVDSANGASDLIRTITHLGRKIWDDGDQRIFAAAMAVVVICAMLIAFL